MDADKIHTKIKTIALLLAVAYIPVSGWGATLLPVGKAENDFVYDRLERQQAVNPDYFDFQLGPYDANEGTFSYGPFDYLRQLAPSELAIFALGAQDLVSVKEQPPLWFESVRGGIAASPIDKLFVYADAHLDERKAKDETYTGKKWRGLAGGIEEAFIHYRAGGLKVMVGRFASFWGPRNSLLLSSTNPLDGFGYSYRWGRLVLSYRLAKLNGLNPEVDEVEQFENRFFAGHRLDVHLSGWLRVGFSETIIYGGPGRQIDLVYLNPIMFFHADQLNEGINDNTLLGFDFSWTAARGVRFYGQVLVDDFQIEKKTQDDQEPDQYGLIVGGHLVDLIPSWDFNLEYNRVTNWTFNQGQSRNRYLLNADLIGGAIGNDYDLVLGSVTRWFGENLAVSLRGSYHRRGEGRVTADWTAPWLDVEGDYDEPFPTGVVEKTLSVSLGVKGFAWNHFYIDAAAGLDRVNNYLHVDGDERDLPFARVRLSSFFSTIVGVD